MAMRYMIVSVFDLKCYIEKNNTYDWKPKKVSKQLNFFHFAIGALYRIFSVAKIFNLSITLYRALQVLFLKN